MQAAVSAWWLGRYRYGPVEWLWRARLSAARAANNSLERELAAYTTESDLNDFGAILDRYSEAETGDIRRILAGRRN